MNVQWISYETRKPCKEDGDKRGNILRRFTDGSVDVCSYAAPVREEAPYWLRIKDIEVPGPVVKVLVDGVEVKDCWVFQKTETKRKPQKGEAFMDGFGQITTADWDYKDQEYLILRTLARPEVK